MIRIELLALGALALGSLFVRVWAHAHAGTSVLNNTLVGYVDWFAVGMALALASVTGRDGEHAIARTVMRRPWIPWSLAGACFLAAASPWLDLPRGLWDYTGFQWAAQHVLYVAIGALLALPAIFGEPHRGLIRRLLGLRVVGWLGLISYGVFLWHAPLMLYAWDHGALRLIPAAPFLSLVLSTTVAAVALGALSYYVVEKPFLRLKYRRRPPDPRASVQPVSASAG
jgi:peptidoglycan/LPS O-acetylase OafA/YrhL